MSMFFFLFWYTNPQPHLTTINRQQYIYMSPNTSLILLYVSIVQLAQFNA
jgi:hypothetical protein